MSRTIQNVFLEHQASPSQSEESGRVAFERIRLLRTLGHPLQGFREIDGTDPIGLLGQTEYR